PVTLAVSGQAVLIDIHELAQVDGNIILEREQFEHVDTFGLALDRDAVDTPELEAVTDESLCGMAHEGAGTVKFFQTLKAACKIDAVTDDRVVEPFLVAHVADDYLGGVNANARGEARLALAFPLAEQGGQPILGSHCRHTGVVGVVVEFDWCTPECHDRIADVFVECSPLDQDGTADDVEIL